MSKSPTYVSKSPTYLVIPFARGTRGKPTAGPAQQFKIRDKAMRAGERAATGKLGALVLEAPVSDDEYAPPILVARLGDVPDEAVEALLAT